MSASTLITDYIGRGLAASRPTSPNIPSGCTAFYYATDTATLYQYTGSAWQSVSVAPPATGANPTATASDVAVNGSATTFMRSDAAPAIQKSSSSVFGVAKVDGTTITAAAGVISGAAAANPTATAADTAVNGTAATFMRSDAAPAIQKSSSSVFGVAKVDGTTITAAAGVISAVSSANPAHPGFKTGRYYTRPTNILLTSLAITANRLYAVPFYVPVTTTFTKFAVYTVTGVASTAVEVGIYTNSNGAPGTLVQDTGNLSTTTSATKTELTGLTITLSPGWYWLCLGGNGAPTLRAAGSNDYEGGMLGFTGPDQSTPFTGFYGAWTYSVGGLPGTFPTLTAPPAGVAETMPLPWLGL